MHRRRAVLTIIGLPVALFLGLVIASAVSPHERIVLKAAGDNTPGWWLLMNKAALVAATLIVFAGWTLAVSLFVRPRVGGAGGPT